METDRDIIRIVVADDHPLFREGVVRTLSDGAGFVVIGEAEDGDAAVDLAGRLGPDIVLLDISMPRGGGLSALKRIMQLPDPPKVALLTVSEEDHDVLAALKAGAVGYILKGVGSRELVSIVRDLVEGRTYIFPTLAAKVLHHMQQSGRPAAATPDPLSELSHREEEILALVAQGKSNREVGEALDLQEKTIKHYMTSILQKLQARNRVEAALIAREHLKG